MKDGLVRDLEHPAHLQEGLHPAHPEVPGRREDEKRGSRKGELPDSQASLEVVGRKGTRYTI